MKSYYCFNKVIALLLTLCISSIAFAQPKETPDSVKFQTLSCLYHSIQQLNNRNIRFKALQDDLENMNPLMPKSMDSLSMANNLTKIDKYLRFLELHRYQITKSDKISADSIKLLSALVSTNEEKRSLANFLHAYTEESDAFILYSQKLTTMLGDIRKAILFLQTVPMEIKGEMVTFNTDRSANEKFMDFQSQIAADQMAVDEAIDRSIKLTEKENKIIMETTSLLNK